MWLVRPLNTTASTQQEVRVIFQVESCTVETSLTPKRHVLELKYVHTKYQRTSSLIISGAHGSTPFVTRHLPPLRARAEPLLLLSNRTCKTPSPFKRTTSLSRDSRVRRSGS